MHAVAELNVTNLVDLAFTLLIIFMIATPLIQQSEQKIPMDLPIESKSQQEIPDKDTVFETIIIDKQGHYLVDKTPVSLLELQHRLREFSARTKQPVISIRADPARQWQEIVTLMDQLKQTKLSKITFDTQTSK